jgi:hypothetical protein
MLSIRPNRCADRNLVMIGELPVERSAQLNLLLLYLDRRTLEIRIHGRPRSDRKRRFLLSAVAPSTSTRHQRKARPINWARRGGLASAREMSPDAEATFHRASCTLATQVVRASDGPPFHQERRPTRVCRTPGPVAICSPKQAPQVIVCWVATASLSTVESIVRRGQRSVGDPGV